MEEKKTKPSPHRPFSCTDCGVLNCGRRGGHYPEFCLTTGLDEQEPGGGHRPIHQKQNQPQGGHRRRRSGRGFLWSVYPGG